MANITLTVGNISNNGVPCKNPVIIVLGTTGDISFPCSKKIGSDGKIKISIPDDLFANKCITLIVRCDECDSCPEKEVTVCLCNDSNDCEACSECRDGICVELCPDKLCVNGSCCDCATTADCNPGFLCDGCNCNCLGKVNSRGECVECLKDSECGPCQLCLNGVCTDIVCPANLICIGGGCGCPRGTVFDQTTGVCIPDDECTDDSQCAECETCVAGFCQPIICPPNYRCVDGECIYWPCTDVTCNNGADCGVDCGCLNGECVPCYLLDCADIASCPSALGCKCNNLEQCVPVNNCGQYCDGSTPCLEPNCTCYNNRCVDCSNFPCPEDCATHYNCGCNAEGDCEGGAGCNDTIVLLKKENCGTDLGCELVAEYTTTNECGCEPIEVRVNNEKSCTAPTPATGDILSLRVELFKNNRPYQDFRNQISIGDDELVQAVVTTTVLHYVKDNTGQWVLTSVPATAVDNVVAIDNKFDPIPLTNAHIKNTFSGKPTKVVVELRIEGVSIPNNDCIDYDSKVIATYELDYSNYTATCAKINGEFKVIKNTFLNDNESVRRPLFVWSKSTTSTFANTKFKNDTGVYAQSGWFRKEYGNLIAGKWTDKLNDPKRFAQDQYNELWNNYNYKVKVDCGCKSNDATLQKVIFCCPKDFEPYYEITDCGRTITIQPFDTCSVNKKLSTLNSVDYIIPTEAQTFYWMVINNTFEKVLVATGGNIVSSAISYTHDEPIISIRFEQRYQGTPLVPVACPVEYTEEPDLPDFTVTSECGTIVVTKNTGSPAITAVTSNTAGVTFTPSSGNTVWTSTSQPLAVSSSHVVKVAFSGTCIVSKTVNIVCDTIIEAVPTSIRANGECQNGVPPNIKVIAIEGFSSAVKFSKDGITYVDPDPPVVGETRPFKIFTNFGAGVYVFYAKETINGVEVVATTDVEIIGMLQPTAIFDPSSTCGNAGSLFKIQGGAPNSTWRITGPQFVSPLSAILDSDGKFSVPIISSNAGLYTAEILTDPSNSTCIPQNISATLLTGGGTVSPTIAFQSSSVCQGQPVGFAIRSGQGLVFNLFVQNGVIKDQNGIEVTSLVSIENGFNGTFIPSTTGSSTITITSIATNVGNCYILGVQVPYSLTVNSGPIVLNSDAFCTPNTIGNYSAFVQTSGTTTGVTIKGLNATEETPDNWWLRGQTFTVGVDTNVEYTAFGATCGVQGYIDLPVCDEDNVCPQSSLTVTIAADVPTCGEVNRTVSFIESELGYIGGAFYQWISLINGSQEFVLESGNVPVNPSTLSRTEQTTFYGYEIFLRITLYGGCVFDSNKVYMRANQLPSPTIVGTTSGVETTGTYQYQVNPVVNGTYVWTLTNSNGINPIGSTTSNIVTISNFTQGDNTINVTVTDGNGCTASDSLLINVALDCPQTVTIALEGGSGSASCKNLLGSVLNLGFTTISSHEWIISPSTVIQSGGGTITPLDTSVFDSGSTTLILLKVYFSGGCFKTSDAYSYTRCNCICNGASCVSTFNTNQGGDNGVDDLIGTFGMGTVINWGFNPNVNSDRMVIKENGIIILDTDIVSSYSSCTCLSVSPGVCDCAVLYLGDEVGNLAVPLAVGTADVSSLTFSVCPTDALEVQSVIADTINGLSCQMGGQLTLSGTGPVTVEISPNSCGAGGTSWGYSISC